MLCQKYFGSKNRGPKTSGQNKLFGPKIILCKKILVCFWNNKNIFKNNSALIQNNVWSNLILSSQIWLIWPFLKLIYAGWNAKFEGGGRYRLINFFTSPGVFSIPSSSCCFEGVMLVKLHMFLLLQKQIIVNLQHER